MKEFVMEKMKEACGVFGIINNDDFDVSRLTYYGLYSLQHRGQESAGIAVKNGDTILCHKDMGLAHEVFDKVILNQLKGTIGIGHVRYSTTGASEVQNAQPMVLRYRNGNMSLAHNGNLVNAAELRDEMESQGAIFQSTNDTEVIANLISRYRVFNDNIVDTLKSVMGDIRGSYAITMITPRRLVGIRDPLGIRPLCLGKLKNSYVIASESCALDTVGAKFVRDIEPGEIVLIDHDGGIESHKTVGEGCNKLCIFEHVYFARPDSIVDGVCAHSARAKAGGILAREYPVEADTVAGTPDGGVDAALGFSRESGIPYGHALIKNRYVGRTFIQPEQEQRDAGVSIKFNPIRSEIEGKRVVLVDDSIVRGTTTRQIVKMLRDAGAKEVHMRISSPPYKFPCFFGIDTSTRKQLVASFRSIDDICEMIGADSLGYLSLEGLLESVEGTKCGFCTACFDGDYPMDVPYETVKNSCG
ncbi:MAG: amidophosphoribosyltransferase [Clostridia bacterium]|nr:amidophosphoribosyltransferase [Clostridia bacterium]